MSGLRRSFLRGGAAKIDIGIFSKGDRQFAKLKPDAIGVLGMEMSLRCDVPTECRAGQKIIFLRRSAVDRQDDTGCATGLQMKSRTARRNGEDA